MANNRKTLLINKKFQLSIISWFSILAILITATFYLSITLFFNEMASQAVEAGFPPGHVFFRFIGEQQSILNKLFLGCSLVAVILILGGGLWLSHQVAGPLYRLVKHMKENGKSKEVPPVKFRKGDYFPEIEEAFNEFIKK